jgi:uncharacterized protein YndB with AHSA1/START domain
MFEVAIWLIVALILSVCVVLAVASTRPDTFHTERTLRIAAPPARLYPLIDDLREMNRWNPFALRDPSAVMSYSGPASGAGAAHQFAGAKSGTGSIEIIEAVAPSTITMRLKMTKPFAADNRVEFTLRPEGTATDVTWAMSGRQPLLAKVMTLFVDCDRMVGREFEAGLGNLKSIAEQGR